jgi:hypothetical protein
MACVMNRAVGLLQLSESSEVTKRVFTLAFIVPLAQATVMVINLDTESILIVGT